MHSWIHFNLQSSIPSPPLPHSRLKSLIPVTISVNSFSCLSLSRLIRDMKVPSSVWGNTLCRAAVKLMKKMLGMKILQRTREKQLDINKIGKPLNTPFCPSKNYRHPKIYVHLAVFTQWVANTLLNNMDKSLPNYWQWMMLVPHFTWWVHCSRWSLTIKLHVCQWLTMHSHLDDCIL